MTAYEAKQIAYNSVDGKTKIVFDDVMRCIKEASERGELRINYKWEIEKEEHTVYCNVIDLLAGLGYEMTDSPFIHVFPVSWKYAQPDKTA